MMKFIHWLIFIKIVLQNVKRLKKIVITEKYCDKKNFDKKDWIIEKDCDN